MVAPIASHLCHLVLLCDSTEEPEQFSHLEEAAQTVAKATENMAAVASRYVQSMYKCLLTGVKNINLMHMTAGPVNNL